MFLQCTSLYPCPLQCANVRVVETYRRLFPDVAIGFSDHTMSNYSAMAAVALGATIIEKHLTLNKDSPGPDHHMSITPDELRILVHDLHQIRAAMGYPLKRVVDGEAKALFKLTKSLVAAGDLPVGHILQAADILEKSPGGGLPPSALDHLVGRMLTRSLSRDEHFSFSDIR